MITNIFKLLLISLIIILSPSNYSDEKKPAPIFNNLGSYHRTISTASPLAQRYFNQGLVLFYSFEYGESIRSFRAAIKSDPQCAMCYWGLALALGSKTDMPLSGHELQEIKAAIKSATQYAKTATIQERAYIAALATRYLTIPPQKLQEIAGICSSYSLVSGNYAKTYANQMRRVMNLFPDDEDAKTLYAASLFDVIEWNFWNKKGQANPYTLEIIKVLEAAIKQNKNHPGANHLYVHIIEFSPYPKRALTSAERLPYLVPGSEHLAHMPSHTYFYLGEYHKATEANQRAINIYKDYTKVSAAQGFKPEIQYLYYHNYDYLIAAASMEGRKALAISTGKTLKELSEPLARKNLYLQKWLTPYILTLSRFGEWQEIMRVPKPPAQFQYALGIWHYARALAEIHFHHQDEARKELELLNQIIKQKPSDKNLNKVGKDLLQLAADTIEGLLAEESGSHAIMIKKLKTAIRIQDEISSQDPPSWYFPIRQLLGSLLLKNGKLLEAREIFLQDLKIHPKNGWSLFGLMKTERALLHTKNAESYEQQFKQAWKYADIKQPIYP